jgi:hypothetical protein
MSTLGTAYLIQRVEDLTAKLDDCAAEKHALELALAASTAYGREQYAQARQAEENYTEAVSVIVRLRDERDAAQAALRARITEVHTLNARLLIAQGGQV